MNEEINKITSDNKYHEEHKAGGGNGTIMGKGGAVSASVIRGALSGREVILDE